MVFHFKLHLKYRFILKVSLMTFCATIQESVRCTGVGVHTGRSIGLAFKPAALGSGINFIRKDLTGAEKIPASFRYVSETRFCTTLTNDRGQSIATVEHVMAALWAFGITDIMVEVDGPEVPIMDGSAAPFLFLLHCAGKKEFTKKQSVLRLKKMVRVETEEGQYIQAMPADTLQIGVSLDFYGREGLTHQTANLSVIDQTFQHDIARARTFGFFSDAQKMWSAGLSQGASLDNTLVFQEGVVMNPQGMRYPNECAKHKLLDLVGDLYLSGHYVCANITACNPGHSLNKRFLDALFSKKAHYSFMSEMDLQTQSLTNQLPAGRKAAHTPPVSVLGSYAS